ncbi:MAG: DUF669 domain-containing protein [Planctomycetes bacterium]|nr:DUF669 domain-containing protein [Planctomycetota bacterium]
MGNFDDVGGFDANQHEPNQSFDVMPAGVYDAIICGSEMKATNDGRGKYLKLELQILNGTFQNRKLFDNLNLLNAGAKKVETERIAKGTLSSICRAVNVLTPRDSSELHNKPLRIKVVVTKDDPQYGKQNRIKSYMPRGGNSGPATTAATPGNAPTDGPTQTQPAPAGNSGQRPWG